MGLSSGQLCISFAASKRSSPLMHSQDWRVRQSFVVANVLNTEMWLQKAIEYYESPVVSVEMLEIRPLRSASLIGPGQDVVARAACSFTSTQATTTAQSLHLPPIRQLSRPPSSSLYLRKYAQVDSRIDRSNGGQIFLLLDNLLPQVSLCFPSSPEGDT